jgi:hypothetical protein
MTPGNGKQPNKKMKNTIAFFESSRPSRQTLKTVQRMVAAAAFGLLASLSAHGAVDTVQMSLDAQGFNYPYASPTDNQTAFAAMMQKAQILGHYDRVETRTSFHATRCMTGVVCYPSPHFETGPDWVDKPLKVIPTVVPRRDAGHWHLDFAVPAENRGGQLSKVTLVLPLTGLWSTPSVQRAVQHAVETRPDYEDDRHAQEDKTVDIDLIVPESAGPASPYHHYCPVIRNPRSYDYSGSIRLRLSIGTPTPLHAKGDILTTRPESGQCPDSSADLSE